MKTMLDITSPAIAQSPAKAWLRALEMTGPIPSTPHRIFPTVIEDLAETLADSPALLSDTECLTYRELSLQSSRYSRWALDQGLAKGDVVCLLMPNRPEYMAVWLGVTRVGVVVSLLNSNLTGASLALHRHRRAQAHHRSCGTLRFFESLHGFSQNLDPWREPRRFVTHRSRH